MGIQYVQDGMIGGHIRIDVDVAIKMRMANRLTIQWYYQADYLDSNLCKENGLSYCG
jgi:hypothetical protein